MLKTSHKEPWVAAGRWLSVETRIACNMLQWQLFRRINNVGMSQKHDTFCISSTPRKTGKRSEGKWRNDVDYLKRCFKSIYRAEMEGVAFFSRRCWAVLRFHPKWDERKQVDLNGEVPGLARRIIRSSDAHDHVARLNNGPQKKSKIRRNGRASGEVDVARGPIRGANGQKGASSRNG
ncbi:hypothetical protein Tco_0278499 [Tanacetum coccineum]